MVRLHYEEKPTTFNTLRLPMLRGYYHESIIQYNERQSHFRVIKFFGRDKGIVLDDGEMVRFEGESAKR